MTDATPTARPDPAPSAAPAVALRTRLLSSLEKVFPDEPGRGPERAAGVLLRNASHSFVLAVFQEGPSWGRTPARIAVDSPLAPWIEVRRVGLVPSELPAYDRRDEGYLRTAPGLYPDVLAPIPADGATWLVPGRWDAFWIRIRGDGAHPLPAGEHAVTVRIESDATSPDPGAARARLHAERTYRATVLDADLPPQRIAFSQWLHCDGIASAHDVAIFSEPFWELLAAYLRVAVDHGVTHLLTPLFTPPLDTAVGGRRPDAQLVDVRALPGGGHAFGFDRLDRWVAAGRAAGIRVFEFAHLFSQWGLASAPRIVVERDGRAEDAFGWESDALGSAYLAFLDAFLPALRAHLADLDLLGACCFHVSDEPDAAHADRYRAAYRHVSRLLGGLPILDAVSDPAFGGLGPDHVPVVALDHLGPFLPRGDRPLWTYHCCGQNVRVSNRFLAMPSGRTRIAGVQLYLHDLQGLLQWGFNFYSSQLSKRAIDPYAVTDADGAFPSGDPFSVYPVPGGCVESLRLVVFHEALQDHAALCALEAADGRDAVLARIRAAFGEDFSFESFPFDGGPLLDFRASIDRALAASAAG